MGRKAKPGTYSRGQGRGRGRATGSSRRTKNSVIPGAKTTGPKLKLKLNMGVGGGQQSAAHPSIIDFDQLNEQQAEEEEEEDLPVAGPVVGSLRSGRSVKQPKADDYVYGSEIDVQMPSSMGKESDEQYRSSPPPTIITLGKQQQPTTQRKLGRPRKSNFQPSLGTINEYLATSDTVQASSPMQVNRHDALLLDIDQEVYQILESLSTSCKVHIDLPTLVHATVQGTEKPYTAQFLMHLYILAYHDAQYNICDLVTDTWIRAFHALRRRDKKRANKEDMTWRPNPTRRMQNHKGFDTRAPRYGAELHTEDPSLDPKVTDFHTSLLDALYTNTRPSCGARLLWVDAMALCGSKLEASMKKHKKQWHPDLVHEVMCTSLRLVRRKLTLKIEESTEGAWCKRYHEHPKHGLPCYRKIAYERKVRGGDSSDEDEQEYEHVMAQMMEAELSRGEKRGLEDGEAETGLAKRMRIGNEEREVLDVNAEGDSDDE